MRYSVYIIFSRSISRYYIGSTQDLKNRLLEHNSGEGKFTSTGSPWDLIWNNSLPTRSAAVQLENKIKKRGAKRFLQDNFIQH